MATKKPQVLHIELPNREIQYLVKYPANESWPSILANLVKRYGRLSDRIIVYTVGYQPNKDSAKIGLNGMIWNEKHTWMWGTLDKTYASIIDSNRLYRVRP